jgi:N-terminal domain of reverse transcriptase
MQAILANGPTRPTDWNAVNWRQVNRRVRNLRQRIFRASQATSSSARTAARTRPPAKTDSHRSLSLQSTLLPAVLDDLSDDQRV